MPMRMCAVSLALGIAFGSASSAQEPKAPGTSAATRLTMTFTAEGPAFAEATEAYRRVWSDEAANIIAAFERVTQLSFFQSNITAIVYEGISSSGNRDTPMRLRASYDADHKKSALVHELGHRLIGPLATRPKDLDEHRVLFLFLYDVWESLWGREFADRQVLVESALRGVYDYESAWKWAQSLTREQRAARFAEVRRMNRR